MREADQCASDQGEHLLDFGRVALERGAADGVPETPEGTCAPAAQQMLLPLLERADAVAIGSGLGESAATRAWVRDLLVHLQLPAVVDADALASLPAPPHAGPRIVTPHAGELARWIGKPSPRRASDRLESALETARNQGVVLLAKGAPSLVATPDGRLFVNGSGHAGLATAGSGDVLTGIVAGLLSQGLVPADAAALGAYLHGLAADVLARAQSGRSLLAGDLLRGLGLAYRELESDAPTR